MAHRKAVVIIPSVTGVPKDAVQNTFHFTTPTASTTPSTTAELESIRDAIKDFYDTAHSTTTWGGSGSVKVTAALSGILLSPTITIKIYRCETEITAGASPEPIITYTVTLGAFNTTQPPHPAEVAACLSFKGTLDTAIPAARQRGRIFLGPLHNGTGGVTANKLVLTTAYLATFAAAGNALRAWATAGIEWVVWSHAALQAFPVTAGWVDDAFDTQRRRGTVATTRTVW